MSRTLASAVTQIGTPQQINNVGNNTTWSTSWTGTALAGDLVLVIIGSSSTGIPTTYAPSGWTQLFRRVGSDSSDVLACYYKFLTSNGGGSVQFASTSGTKTGIAAVFRGVGGVTSDQQNTGGGTSVTAPSVSVALANSAIVCAYFQDDVSTTATTITLPARLTALSGGTIGSGTSRVFRGGYDLGLPVGATGTIVATSNKTSDSIASTILLSL